MRALHAADRLTPGFEIRVGTSGDIDTLCEIDLDASRLFERAGLELNLPEDHEFFHRERARWVEALACGSTLLAVDPNSRIMGFAASGVRDREPYLDQLSVRSEFMRMGVGSALLAAAEKLAVVRGGRALWLTTYGHLSWNRPFYERAGFVVTGESAWGPEILTEATYERRWLPCPEQRIVMRKQLGSARSTH
ncbi:MAG TPA: GNAT family N-acetyltransferase [Steroidobacteraceae bacterium]|jgi:GNAT superfamily N-acetyltransferase